MWCDASVSEEASRWRLGRQVKAVWCVLDVLISLYYFVNICKFCLYHAYRNTIARYLDYEYLKVMYKFTIIQQQLITEKKKDDLRGHRSDTRCLHPPVQHQETRYISLVGRPGACRPEVEVVLKLVPGIWILDSRVSESSCTDSTSPRWPSSWGWSWD